jgi:hypothetical protein
VIRNRQVVALPLASRQFLDLAMFSGGVVRPPGGIPRRRNATGRQSGERVGTAQRPQSVPCRRLHVTDEYFNNLVVAPSIDSIEEFNIIEKTSYAPEFGGKSGAVINVITKSGSNQYLDPFVNGAGPRQTGGRPDISRRTECRAAPSLRHASHSNLTEISHG